MLSRSPGFFHWLNKLSIVCLAAGIPISFYASPNTLLEIKSAHQKAKSRISVSYNDFDNWEDFLIFSRELKPNDFFVVITSRKGHISYNNYLERLPYYLGTYFNSNSFLIVYPKQLDQGINMNNIEQVDPYVIESIADKISTVGKSALNFKRIFKK